MFLKLKPNILLGLALYVGNASTLIGRSGRDFSVGVALPRSGFAVKYWSILADLVFSVVLELAADVVEEFTFTTSTLSDCSEPDEERAFATDSMLMGDSSADFGEVAFGCWTCECTFLSSS